MLLQICNIKNNISVISVKSKDDINYSIFTKKFAEQKNDFSFIICYNIHYDTRKAAKIYDS
jgi:hypothetical protein